jgi:hypothetical protein
LPATSQLAVALVNWLASLRSAPHPLPRMDLAAGIPPALRTLVMIPTLLSGRRNLESLVEALEIRFLANRDGNLHFGLLTDFGYAAQEVLARDAPLLALARERIEALNAQYAGAGKAIFFLFHRPRWFNPGTTVQ